MSGFDIARDCSHGMLGRACERCDDAREIAELRARVAELDAERKRMLDSLIVTAMELDELRARAEELEDENARLLAALQAAVRANKALMDERDIAASALRILYEYERWADSDRNREDAMNAAADALARLECAAQLDESTVVNCVDN